MLRGEVEVRKRAVRIAERVRSAISGLCIIAPGATGGERVHVTVSIGVAALDSGSKREYAELIAAARWSRTHDPSEGYAQVLRGVLTSLGVEDVDLST